MAFKININQTREVIKNRMIVNSPLSKRREADGYFRMVIVAKKHRRCSSRTVPGIKSQFNLSRLAENQVPDSNVNNWAE